MGDPDVYPEFGARKGKTPEVTASNSLVFLGLFPDSRYRQSRLPPRAQQRPSLYRFLTGAHVDPSLYQMTMTRVSDRKYSCYSTYESFTRYSVSS